MKKLAPVIFLIIAVTFLWIVLHSNNNALITAPNQVVVNSTSATSSAQTNQVLGIRKKTEGCIAKDTLQDKDCTPGAIFDTATKERICIPGYSKSVRNVPESEKNQVYAEYNIATHTAGEYEVDHLISLELGGSNDISNLWPESADPRPGFHEKDQVENLLHKQVCDGQITLQRAQQEISNNWLEVYQSNF